MAVLVLLIASISSFLVLVVLIKSSNYLPGWRLSILAGTLVLGFLAWGSAELLSMFNQLNRLSLSLFWIICFAITWLAGIKRRHLIMYQVRQLIEAIPGYLEGFIVRFLILLVFLGLIFLIALIAAPNNWDSMTYHLSRVMHWIQNQDLNFYPTHIDRQLWLSPGAELAVLHIMILIGESDQLVNLVQFSAFLIGLLGLSWITKILGGTRPTQFLAIVIAATIPMAILQATSTQNDLVEGLWLICFVAFGLLALQDNNLRIWALIGGSLGLAILTKSTAYIIAAPFVIWFGLSAIKRKLVFAWKPAMIVLILVVLINLPHILQNTALYGNPLGYTQPGEKNPYINESFSPASLGTNILRNIGLHVGVPNAAINQITTELFYRLAEKLPIDLNDPRNTIYTSYSFKITYSRHEDLAVNLLHLILFIIAFFLFLGHKDVRSQKKWLYLLSIMGGFMLFSLILKWQPWHSRMQLPLFLLSAPWVAAVFGNIKLRRVWIIPFIEWMLIIGSLPYLLMNSSRPLLGSNSILSQPRDTQYFTNQPGLEIIYKQAINDLSKSGCKRVGLYMGSDDWEYPLWALTRSTGQNLVFEHIAPQNVSARYSQPFLGCAILYTNTLPPDEYLAGKLLIHLGED